MWNLRRTVSEADIAAVRAMSYDERDALRIKINSTLPRDVFESGKGDEQQIICDMCGNGTGKDATPVKPTLQADGTWLYNCFRGGDCNFHGDLIKLIATENNLDPTKDFFEVLAIGANITHISLYDSTPAQNIQPARTIEVEKSIEFERLAEARENLPTLFKDRETFRGLPSDVFKRLSWGYLQDFSHHKTPFDVFPAVIIPNVKGGIFARGIGNEKKMSNISPTAPTIINLDFGTDFILTVVEGAINGASLAYATDFKYSVIATGGTSGGDSLLEFLNEKFPTQKPKILLMFDRDGNNAGKNAAEKLLKKLKDSGFIVVIRFIDERADYDFNDFLMNEGKTALADRFNKIFVDAEEEIAKVENFNNRAQAWEKFNDIIDPAILEELRQAEKYFNSLTAENITAKIILDSKRNIALCKVHDFCELSATEFITKIENAIQTADNKVKTARKDNSPVDADTEVLANVSIRDFKADIEKQVSQVRKDRKIFVQNYNAKISKQKHDKFLAERQLLKARRAAEIEKLLQAPLTDETAKEIIANITENLEWAVDKFGERVKVKATAMNFKEIFCNDPYIKDLVAYDEFQQSIVFAKRPPWKKDSSCISEPWQDSDDSEIRIYLRETYHELAHEQMTYDYLTSYANKKSFHVVKDYFNGLPEWDEKKRAEEIFIKFLRVDDTPYTREITLKFLLAAMARIYHPGCNFQSALVLQGAQSIGKSFVIERLGGKFHTTLSDNVDDSHAIDALQNSWIVEMKEFSAARKSDVNALKSFIERPADNRRAAYARRAQISKRHCVFAITVNDESFLRDQTGNRRFWILKCKSKMFEIVEGLDDDYIRQIWAEIKVMYDKLFAEGFDDTKLQLSIETKRRAEEVADEFMQDDGMKGEIEAFLDTKIPHKVIWQLLTKEQRRKFFENNSITIQESTLRALHNSNHFSSDTEFEDVLHQANFNKIGGFRFTKGESKDAPGFYTFFGVELRQSICAAEILNECFVNSDRRKSSQKISELLTKIEGWQLGGRNKKYPCYGDQKKIYYRVNEEVQNSEQPNSAEEVEEDLPF